MRFGAWDVPLHTDPDGHLNLHFTIFFKPRLELNCLNTKQLKLL